MVVLLSVAVAAALAGYVFALRRSERAVAGRERVLAEWETRFKSLLATTNDAVFLFDADTTRIIDCNPRAEELVGLPCAQIIGLHHADLYAEEQAELARERFAATVGARGGSVRDLQIWHRSGYAIPIELKVSVASGNGRSYALGVMRNISSDQDLELVLRRERHLTDSIVETVNALVMVLDREGRIIRFNNACELVSGYSSDEVRGRCIWGLFVADRDKKRVRDLFSAVLAGQFPIHYENVWRTRQGVECSIAWSNNAILDDRGAVQYVIATGIDVTARKATEAALRRAHDEMEKRVVLRTAALRSANDALVQSEARLAEAQRIARMGNWERDIATGRLLWSEEVFQIFGLSHDGVPTFAEMMTAVHPEDRERVGAAMGQAVIERAPYSLDYRIVCPDGSERVVHDQGVVNYDGDGRAVTMVGTTQDITERKAAEEALRRAHDELEERVEARTAELRLANQALGFTQFAMDHAGDAVFWVDDSGRFVYVNEAACKLLGYERPELLGFSWDKLCLTAEDNWGTDLRFAQEASIFESLLRTRDGTALPVEVTASHLFFDGVEYTCFFARDIRERRRAEVARLAQLQAARTLSTISSRFVSGDDIDVAVSEALTDLRALLDARCAWLLRVDRSAIAVEWLSACANAPDVERFAPYIEALRRGEVRVIYDDAPEGGGTSTVLVPLFAEQVMIGVIGFEEALEAERWREGDFPVLRVAARVMTAGIQRHRAELQTMRLLEENRMLARQSLEIQESERAHLARELHDELGQCLTAIRADAQSICRLTQDKEPRVYASGKAISEVASRVYEVVRNIMRRLRPEMLDQLGLGAALRDVVNQWRNRQPEMEWVLEVSEPLGSLPEATQITAFRVVQECITNVIKHAGATRVEITALRSPKGLEVVVRDNGHGGNPRNGGLGLLGMRERVLAAGGVFELTNKPGHGYCIRALFPLNEGEEMRNAS